MSEMLCICVYHVVYVQCGGLCIQEGCCLSIPFKRRWAIDIDINANRELPLRFGKAPMSYPSPIHEDLRWFRPQAQDSNVPQLLLHGK